MKTQSTRRLVPHFNIERQLYAEILIMGLIPSNLLLCIVLLECDGESDCWKWCSKLEYCLCAALKSIYLFDFSFFQKQKWVQSLEEYLYSGITGAGSGSVGLGIGEYDG